MNSVITTTLSSHTTTLVNTYRGTHTHARTHVPNITPFTSDVPTLVGGGGGWYLVYSKTRQIFVFN